MPDKYKAYNKTTGEIVIVEKAGAGKVKVDGKLYNLKWFLQRFSPVLPIVAL